MSGTINDAVVTTWPASIADILNGDDANNATFSPPITDLAKRTRFDHDELFTRGIRRIKSFASAAAAKAVATGDVSTGDIARIAGLGIFFYNASTAGDPDLSPQQLLVTGTAGGIWRNIAMGFESKAIANGMASLDGSALVPSAQLRGHWVAEFAAPSTGGTAVNGTGTGLPVRATGNVNNVRAVTGLKAGDVIQCCAFGTTSPTLGASQFAYWQYAVEKTDGTVLGILAQNGGFGVASLPSGGVTFPMAGRWVVQASDLLTPTSTTLNIVLYHIATNALALNHAAQGQGGGISVIRAL